MEERYRRKPTIITTNLGYEEWLGLVFSKMDREPDLNPVSLSGSVLVSEGGPIYMSAEGR
jgi:hypothetical protein